MAARGFIFQASYRVESDARGRRRPVVHLYGRLEDGGTFLVRDDRQRPHFYVREIDGERARASGAPAPLSADRRTFAGEPACRVEVPTPQDVPGLRERLHGAGVETFEADVRFAVRYLIDRGIKGGCEIVGEAAPGAGVSRVFENPELRPASVDVEPRVLSFDIETDLAGERLLAISLFARAGAGHENRETRGDAGLSSPRAGGAESSAPAVDEVLVVDSSDRPMPPRATRCADERAALDAFCARIAAFDPDVLTGWNTIDFDLTVLERIAARLRHPLELGRGPGRMRLRKAEGYFGSGQATIPGRLVLDGIDLLRGAFVRMDDYSLDAVAREVLGEGKALKGEARERHHEILHNYEHDLPAFALYARTDARLALEIVERLDLVPLAFERSRLTGMTPDRVAASIASFDFLYLAELEKRRIVAPSVRSGDSRVHAAQQGGHVLEPVTGLHRNVWVFDFKSLYPSIIRSLNIDPLTYVERPEPGADLIRTEAAAFKREPGILPRMLDELFPRREAAKQRGDAVAANAIKILMNSFYGVLGTPACRFSNPALANAITGTGRELLLWSKHWFEAAGFTVLYGDTDSLFVASGLVEADAAAERGRALAPELNAALARHVESRWRVASRLEIEFEKLYLKLFLPHARHSARGASKRYAGLLHGGGVEFVGMEVVRRDWTELAKQVQRELYERLFAGEPVEEYLASIVKRVRRGELDDALVYRKQLRKRADAYTASTPPHVAAARKSSQSGRLVAYVVTAAGAEPLDNVQSPLDREHYVQKQVKPVAEPVLETLGLEFERVIGDERQLDLLAELRVQK
ncbi:MAG TPA: DNA polymerase II [Gammaproteobacteria bacterium]|nr:DNA polymerase II [Gammaproteobacteria bacterium]